MSAAASAGAAPHRMWWLLVVVAGGAALVGAGRWLWALASGLPVLYGEGAVAHAALLARDRLEYTAESTGAIFVAANYPPLYFHLAAVGDPFMTGRLLSIAATLFVAGAIAYRARPAGAPVAIGLAAAWLATAPVAVWGSAVKPDLVALAFTVGAVLAVGARRTAVAGALLALACWTKPTAALPALALLAFLVLRERSGVPRFAASGLAALVLAALATVLPGAPMYEHVVTWNALPWHADQALLMGVLVLFISGAAVVAFVVLRPGGPVLAYAIGALGIAALGGREGATFNYLLDLLAAIHLGIAQLAPRIRLSPVLPVAIVLQLLAALALFDPLGILPGRAISTGAWGRPDRIEVVRSLPGTLLVEDSGLLVADGRAPAVDDLFLWSRLQDARADDRLLAAVRDGAFGAIVSETDLARMDTAPLWARQRWHESLVSAVLSRYRLDRSDAGVFVYLPR